MEIKGIVKKKFPLKSGKNNKNLGNKIGILNYATGKGCEQYEKGIRSVKTLFDGIV